MPVNPLPIEIRKCCLRLGLQSALMTRESVHEAWKQQLAPTAHPDFAGDNEAAIELNSAKDTLIKWLSVEN